MYSEMRVRSVGLFVRPAGYEKRQAFSEIKNRDIMIDCFLISSANASTFKNPAVKIITPALDQDD